MKRLTYRYYLKSSNKLTPESRVNKEPVWVRVSLPSCKIDGKSKSEYQYINLGVNVKPKYFGHVTKSGKGITYCSEVVNSNLIPTSDFRKMQIKFDSVMDSLFNKFQFSHPENYEIKDYIEETFAYDPMQSTKNINSISTYIDNYVAFLNSIKGSGRGESVKDNTIRKYPVVRKIIDAYDLSTNKKLTFSTLTEAKFHDIWRHANEAFKSKTNAPYKPRTLCSYQACLLDICSKAQSSGEKLGLTIHKNLKIDLTKVKLDNEKVNLYIEEQQLAHIVNHRFQDPNWENARQYMVIASFTGMRIQSMLWCSGQPIFKCNKKGYTYIDSEQGKTGTECYIPLPQCVQELCKDNRFPVFEFSEVTYNKTFKLILKYFEFDRFKDFSSHNFRSTLVTILANNLIDLDKIALITHPKKLESKTNVNTYVRSEKLYRSEKFYVEARQIQLRNPTTMFKY